MSLTTFSVKTLQHYSRKVVCFNVNYYYDKLCYYETNVTNSYALKTMITKQLEKHYTTRLTFETVLGEYYDIIDFIDKFLKRVLCMCAFSLYLSCNEKADVLKFFESRYHSITVLKRVNETIVRLLSDSGGRTTPLINEALKERERILAFENKLQETIKCYDEDYNTKERIQHKTVMYLQIYNHYANIHSRFSAKAWTADVSFFFSRMHDLLDELYVLDHTPSPSPSHCPLSQVEKVRLLGFINHCSGAPILADIEDLRISELVDGAYYTHQVLMIMEEFKRRMHDCIEKVLQNLKLRKYNRTGA